MYRRIILKTIQKGMKRIKRKRKEKQTKKRNKQKGRQRKKLNVPQTDNIKNKIERPTNRQNRKKAEIANEE